MKCPFLQETEVRSCQSAGIRKLIRQIAAGESPADEKCSSRRHAECSVYQAHAWNDSAANPSCPSLHTSLVNFCAAAPVTRFVPYSDSPAARCGHGTFRYCDVYLGLACAGEEPGDRLVEGIPMPGRLAFSANHMWLDRAEDGGCHIGVDAFLAKAVRRVDHVAFATPGGLQHPTAVLTTQGVELHMVFPNPVVVIQPNLYLRADPARITADPYRAGWLFEAQEAEGAQAQAGLLSGAEADEWMRRESECLSVRAHEQASKTAGGVAADGGTFGSDFLEHLSREEKLALLHEFFSPYAGQQERR